MPIQKPHLNREEQAGYLAAIQELRIAGLDVDIPKKWMKNLHFLDIAVAGGPATGAFDLPNGGVGYAICLRLAALQPDLTLPHCRITTQWDDQILPLNFEERSPICKLGWVTYSRNEVLNQHLDNSLRFYYRGQLIEGTILAMGLRSIPASYRTGACAPFQLTFGDPIGREIGVEAELYVDRIAKKKNATVRSWDELYEPLNARRTGAVPAAGYLPADMRVDAKNQVSKHLRAQSW